MIGYMQAEQIFLTGLAIAGVVFLLVGVMLAISRRSTRRLRIIEQALQSGNLSHQTEQLLVAELTKPGFLGRLFAGGRVLLVLGWLGIFIGISIIVSDQRNAEEVGIPFALMSFAVLTIPFALRELDRKREPASRRP